MGKYMRLIVAAGIIAGCCASCLAGETVVAKIYIPASVAVQSDTLSLGSVCVISCGDEAVAQKMSAIAMGRSPGSKEKITINRQTILARLASSGFAASQVQLTGADSVAVTKDERNISVQEILRAAEGYLQEKRPGPEGCIWKLSKPAAELNVPAARDIRITTGLSKESTAQLVVLEVAITSGEKELARTKLQYAVMFPAQRAVASKDIRAGTPLTQENIKIETVPSATKIEEAFKAPYGMVAAKNIVAGTVIQGAVATPPKSDILVKRAQSVTMRIQGTGFEVSAVGEAMEDGRGGDVIKVRNSDTKRIITAKVAFDGTVEPIVGEPAK